MRARKERIVDVNGMTTVGTKKKCPRCPRSLYSRDHPQVLLSSLSLNLWSWESNDTTPQESSPFLLLSDLGQIVR